jgi:hypothetical protein
MYLVAVGLGIIVFLTLFIVAQFIVPDNKKEKYHDYDWSSVWTDLDRKGRASSDCKPITVIHRKLGLVSAYIWIVPDSCEQGLPHTRSSDIVAIPKSFPKNRLEITLEHEKIHLYQRLMPDSWRKFYRLKWNYELYTEPPVGMDAGLIKMRRSNPDTADSPWVCWRKYHWPVPVYISINNLSLSNAPIKWFNSYDLSISERPPEGWIAFFGSSVSQLEHPHEISAEFLAGPLKRIPDTDELEVELSENAPPAMRLLDDAWRYDEMHPLI